MPLIVRHDQRGRAPLIGASGFLLLGKHTGAVAQEATQSLKEASSSHILFMTRRVNDCVLIASAFSASTALAAWLLGWDGGFNCVCHSLVVSKGQRGEPERKFSLARRPPPPLPPSPPPHEK